MLCGLKKSGLLSLGKMTLGDVRLASTGEKVAAKQMINEVFFASTGARANIIILNYIRRGLDLMSRKSSK